MPGNDEQTPDKAEPSPVPDKAEPSPVPDKSWVTTVTIRKNFEPNETRSDVGDEE